MRWLIETPTRTLSVVTWKDVCDEVRAVNKELASIIDEICPDDSYKFIQAEYLYGDFIIKNGVAQFPSTEKTLLPITSNRIDEEIKKELYYSSLPLVLFLNKDHEVFLDTGARAIPLNLFHKGSFAGAYEAMDFITGIKSEPMWTFSSGSRSIMMLPKITERSGLERLRAEYNIPPTIQVKEVSEHWRLFKYIAQSPKFKHPWRDKVLYCGAKWLTNQHTSPDWLKFKDYLLRQIWLQAQYTIDKVKFSTSWERFAEIISLRRLQPNPYLIDQVKHILSIVLGNFPAFRPMNEASQDAAPIKGLQEAFIDTYMLREYLPTMLNACRINDEIINPSSVYYSLSYPTLLEGSPLKKTSSTIMWDMREIKMLVSTLRNYPHQREKLVRDSFSDNVQFEYFHAKQDIYGEVKDSADMLKEDTAFLADKERYPGLKPCSTGPFLKGCIRISVPATAQSEEEQIP